METEESVRAEVNQLEAEITEIQLTNMESEAES